MTDRYWMTYPIPLQETGEPVHAHLTVPTNLTRVEADRIKEMLDALVLTVEQERPAYDPADVEKHLEDNPHWPAG